MVLAVACWLRLVTLFLDDSAGAAWKTSGMYTKSTQLMTLGGALQDAVLESLNYKTVCRQCGLLLRK